MLAAGGLKIVGTERHESRRIDNQLRGRAGRQGDPGSSRFYLSLQDDLLRIFGLDRMTGLMERLGLEEDVPIESPMVTRSIENAQKKVEGRNFDQRKNVLEYDDVMNQQRKTIYALRRQILDGRYHREPTEDEAEAGHRARAGHGERRLDAGVADARARAEASAEMIDVVKRQGEAERDAGARARRSTSGDTAAGLARAARRDLAPVRHAARSREALRRAERRSCSSSCTDRRRRVADPAARAALRPLARRGWPA